MEFVYKWIPGLNEIMKINEILVENISKYNLLRYAVIPIQFDLSSLNPNKFVLASAACIWKQPQNVWNRKIN